MSVKIYDPFYAYTEPPWKRAEWERYKTLKVGQRIHCVFNQSFYIKRHRKGWRRWFSGHDYESHFHDVEIVDIQRWWISLDIGRGEPAHLSPHMGHITHIDGVKVER